MITLGIDIGSSSIKVSLFDAERGKSIAGISYPPEEMEIVSHKPDWAEQDPEGWMLHLFEAVEILKRDYSGSLYQVGAIGITYQMHGLVIVDRQGNPVRDSIIWCDSRAVNIGKKAYEDLGGEFCLSHLLNSPGNFTASKLKWVKEYEPEAWQRVHKFMLPGDYIAFRLTNQIATTASGLSEGILWDFERNALSEDVFNYYGFQKEILPEIVDTFSVQGRLTGEMAGKLGMKALTPVTYRAGDQPNNALSLKVLNPGEVAATAGTSGVVYGVTDAKKYDPLSRVNTFLHVNNSLHQPRLGILLCLNSVGILNSWARHQLLGTENGYDAMNIRASEAPEGSEGLFILPFGNGAERVLENRNIGASVHGLNLTRHRNGHILRAIQESIAFAFNYGLEMMQPLGLDLTVIRAGKANMFLSPLFASTLSNLSGARIELYNTDGAEGAARGAAIGAGFYSAPEEAFNDFKVLETVGPDPNSRIVDYYHKWKEVLENTLQSNKN
jgi:xylulokinase